MTKLLQRLFHVSCGDPESTAFRVRVGRLSSLTGIVCNTVLCLLKLLAGTLSGSLSITADAMNNLSDTASSLITLVGFRLSARPADRNHPYGHARFEYLSGLAVAVIILLIGAELLKTSVLKIIHPEPIVFSWTVAAVLIASIGVKLWLSLFNRTLGRQIGSTALLATAADSRNDTISTGAVLLSAGLEALTGWHIDGFAGLAVAGFILWSGISMGMETISPLLGEASNPELNRAIANTLRTCPQVLGFHDLMVHDYGPGKRFASIHVEMDRRRDPMESHEIIDGLERACQEQHNVHLVIHYDPIVVGDPVVDSTREQVTALLQQLDSRLSLHDFRMVAGPAVTNLLFDVGLPEDMQGREADIRQHVEQNMALWGKTSYSAQITFDPQAFQNY